MGTLQLSPKMRSVLYKGYKLLLLPFVGREMLEAEEQLKQYKFKRKSSIVELAAILLFLAFVSVVIWIVVEMFDLERVSWSQAFTAILSLGIAIIAYRQWRGARHEISIDKYYDRLESANKRLEVLETDKPTAEDMHAFAELDKLEYVIVKYEYGYISPVLALRALKNFHGLCIDRKGFSEKASHWVHQASYREITRRVAKAVCEECQSPSIPKAKN
jgi:hypothetical protein